ncbi:MAG: epoxide hydrolase family protein [Nakamurella sp.]
MSTVASTAATGATTNDTAGRASGTEIRPFRIAVPQSAIDDLRARLARTRYSPPVPSDGAQAADYGVGNDRVGRLIDYWQTGYDWRAWEAKINSFPQFLTEIDGQTIHFLHIRSTEPDALPLLLTHGWPGSIVEFLDVIGPLTDPRAHGGDPASAFDVVIPSLPGFGFSGPAETAGWGTTRTAATWAELMRRLGYRRYGAAGNDAGSMISPEVGRTDPAHVVGVHVTQIFSFPTGDPAEFENLSADEAAGLQTLQWFWDKKGAFNILHSQQPQTLAHALSDSPAGLLGWNSQLFDDDLDDDFVLTNTSIYWFTNTGGSSIRFYYEDAQRKQSAAIEPTTVPLGLCSASTGDFGSIRRFADRDHRNIRSWHVHDNVHGHYAAHQAPGVLVDDIREFYRDLR